MRSHTVAERNILAAEHREYHKRVETKNASGTWVDLTNLDGFDFVDDAEITEHIDNPVASATISVAREARRTDGSVASLAPFMAASTLNRDDLNAYAPLLNAGRDIRIITAVTAPGVAPVAGDWKHVLLGKIDHVSWASDPVKITCRDIYARVLDAFIEVERIYGSLAGVAVETVMQSILNDTFGSGVYTIVTPVSPAWMLGPFTQTWEHVLSALRTLALQLGWDIRGWWNSSGNFELRFYAPDRTKTVPDATFGPDEYFDISNLSISDADVRNVASGIFTDAATHLRRELIRTNSASIAEFGRRWMQFEFSATHNINTEAEMQTLLDRALSDLAMPIADQSVDISYFWPAQLGDLYRHLANAVHYDSAQDYAVVGFTHHMPRSGDMTTTIITRGKPAGAYRDWLTRGVAVEGERAPIIPPDFEIERVVQPTKTGGVVYAVASYTPVGGQFLDHVEFHVQTRPTGSGDAYGVTTIIQGGNSGSDRIELQWNTDYRIAMVAVTTGGVLTPVDDRPVREIASGPPPSAVPLLTSVTVMPDKLVYRITFDEATTRAQLWVSEYSTDPGVPTSRVNHGTLIAEIQRGDNHFAAGQNFCDIAVHLARSSNWQVASTIGWNALDQIGIEHAAVKTQGSAVTRPSDILVTPVEVAGSTTATNAEIDVTMPASIANFDGIQIWRDGQLVAGVSRSAGAGAVQRIQVAGLAPNRTYVFQFKGYDAPFPGVESANFSPSVSITTTAGTIATPSLALSSWYNVSGQGLFLRVTPGANTPVGTRFRVSHGASASGPWFDVESSLDTTIFHTHVQSALTDYTDYLRVRATHPDWTQSAESSVVSIVIPRGVPGHF